MSTLIRLFAILLAVADLSVLRINAQQPQTVVVAAADSNTNPTPAPAQPSTPNTVSLDEAIRTLMAMKAANQDVLTKQQAALEQLDEMQLAANQLKIFTHRTGG